MILQNITIQPVATILFLAALVIAVTFHEFAHAWTAVYLGDPTPSNQGRVSLNPLKHLDLLGSIFFLIAGIGWGKPVITNPQYYKKPMTGYAITSLAGPAANLILGFISSIPGTILIILGYQVNSSLLLTFTESLFQANIILFAFNLIPIYPLDGSKLVMLFIKNPVSLRKYMYWSPKILMILLFMLYFFQDTLGFLWYPFIIIYEIPYFIIRTVPQIIFT
ncbi:site-2 protease family protein [Patescibacteria group bacterium]|nr:site-2 protease family protein [Patescibacteria group bacterium]